MGQIERENEKKKEDLQVDFESIIVIIAPEAHQGCLRKKCLEGKLHLFADKWS